jgi:hypothetical protein
MLAPPPLDDARRSLAYWQQRHRALPFYQRRARAEAREMAARWDDRVRAAERAQFAKSPAGRILAALGLSRFFPVLPTKRQFVFLVWSIVPPPLKAIAAGVVATCLLVMVASATLAAAVLIHLA